MREGSAGAPSARAGTRVNLLGCGATPQYIHKLKTAPSPLAREKGYSEADRRISLPLLGVHRCPVSEVGSAQLPRSSALSIHEALPGSDGCMSELWERLLEHLGLQE